MSALDDRVFTCPHCDEGIDTVGRTGDKRYTCSECNRVVKYDDVEPFLDELEVVDKREADEPEPEPEEQNVSEEQEVQEPVDEPSHNLNEREIIYQRGRDGLKEIKQERLKNWLSLTEGVGGQTEDRILRLFEKNETFSESPNALYQMLDDQISASPSYINTVVSDVFAPERDHEDLLNDQGYTPWFRQEGQGRGTGGMAPGGGAMGQGGPGMQGQGPAPGNAPGSSRQQQGQQGMQNQQSQQGGGDNLTREEAVELISAAAEGGQEEAEKQRRGGNIRDGVSEATDKALEEMAQNVGGFFGTLQEVVNVSLVEYAKDNPEWVIENADMIQKFMDATEGDGGGPSEPPKSEQDQKVDDALDSLGGGGGGQMAYSEGGGPQRQGGQRNQRQQQRGQQRQQGSQPQQRQGQRQQRQGQSQQRGNQSRDQGQSQQNDQQQTGFQPDQETQRAMTAGPDEPYGQEDTSNEEPEESGQEEEYEEEDIEDEDDFFSDFPE